MDSALRASQCVDVVIPVYNGVETIRDALTSVFEQQGDWVHRIIVIDDGSSDDTAKLVQDLDSPLIEIVSTPNQGVAKARNLGIEISTTEWIAFLDADDVWMPSKLEDQLRMAKEHDVEFVCSSVSANSLMTSCRINPQLLARGNFVATSSVLVKRSVLNRIQPVFTPGMSFAEDYLAWLKCVTLSPGYYISDKLVDYILSEQPRYNWGLILRNIVAMNIRYASFLRESDLQPKQSIGLAFAVGFGSLRSIFSICKRFIASYPSASFTK
jgi:glycosyltransferase involved in cell wall biosynthesis